MFRKLALVGISRTKAYSSAKIPTITVRYTPLLSQYTRNRVQNTFSSKTTATGIVTAAWFTNATISDAVAPVSSGNSLPSIDLKAEQTENAEYIKKSANTQNIQNLNPLDEILSIKSKILENGDDFATWISVLLDNDEQNHENNDKLTKKTTKKMKKRILKEKDIINHYLHTYHMDPTTFEWCKDDLYDVFLYTTDALSNQDIPIVLPPSPTTFTDPDIKKSEEFANLIKLKQIIEKERYKVFRSYQSIQHISTQMLQNLTQINFYLHQYNHPDPTFFNQQFISPQMAPIYRNLHQTILSLGDIEKCYEPSLILYFDQLDKMINNEMKDILTKPSSDNDVILKKLRKSHILLQQQLFCTMSLAESMDSMLAELILQYNGCHEFYNQDRSLLFIKLAEMEGKINEASKQKMFKNENGENNETQDIDQLAEINNFCASAADIYDFSNPSSFPPQPLLDINPLTFSQSILSTYSNFIKNQPNITKYTSTGYISREQLEEQRAGIELAPITPLERFKRYSYNRSQLASIVNYNKNGALHEQYKQRDAAQGLMLKEMMKESKIAQMKQRGENVASV